LDDATPGFWGCIMLKILAYKTLAPNCRNFTILAIREETRRKEKSGCKPNPSFIQNIGKTFQAFKLRRKEKSVRKPSSSLSQY
jgi:hypothetical protein